MLKSSDPQNKIRSGSVDFVDTCRRGHNVPTLVLAKKDTTGGLGNSRCCMTGITCKSPAFRESEN